MTIAPHKCAVARLRSDRGMSIFEVLVASTILIFVVAAAISALSSGLGYIRHARMTTLAGQITQSAMEQLRLANYASIKAYAAQSQPVDFTGIISTENFTSGFTAGMTVRVRFTTMVESSTGVLGKAQATITTTWPEYNVFFTRRTTTVFTEKGLSDYIYSGWSNL